MATDHGEHGHSAGHGASKAGAWMEQHLGGLVMGFGKRMEILLEHLLFLFINGLMKKAGIAFLVIMAPVILLEFVLHSLPF